MSDAPRWQPILLVLEDGTKRLECKCGALGIIVTGKLTNDGYNKMEQVDVWCQQCFQKAVDEQSGGIEEERD